MQRIFFISLFIICSFNIYGQENVVRKGFRSPFNFPLLLSGNFGELRENHFHGGLDFKTHYQTGKKLLALADGYISRVQVTHDSGYVVHVCYKNGFTTINRHLQGLVGELAHFVDSVQYANEKWVMSANFGPKAYPVKSGEQIGWSGNMGYSFAPHLHLDVYETRSKEYIDPLPFFETLLKDSRAPRARGFMIYPQRNKGVVDHSYMPLTYPVEQANPIYAWGDIGVAIRAYDYMDGVSNKYGVKHMKVYVDGKPLFKSHVDRYAFYEHKYINSWSYKDYMKAFIEPGNKLRMLKALNGNRGIVSINEERPYLFTFVLSDYYGNKSTYKLTVVGKKEPIPVRPSTQTLYWNQYNKYSELGLDLEIPQKQLYDTTDLNVQIYPQDSRDSVETFIYQLVDQDNYVPFHRGAKLSIRIPDNYPHSKWKLYIARITDKDRLRSEGGQYKNGFMTTNISKLGTFTLALDTIPPVVKALNKNRWSKKGEIVFSAKDYQTGIHSYKGTIDGKYALFYLDIMPDKICYTIDKKRLKRGETHQVVLEVVDKRGNKTLVKENFYW